MWEQREDSTSKKQALVPLFFLVLFVSVCVYFINFLASSFQVNACTKRRVIFCTDLNRYS